MTGKAAAVGLLIALSGCTEKVDASDPPAIGLAAGPDTYVHSEMPAEIVTESPPPAESPATSAANAVPVRNLRERTRLFMNFSPAAGGQISLLCLRGGYTGLSAAPTTSRWMRLRLALRLCSMASGR